MKLIRAFCAFCGMLFIYYLIGHGLFPENGEKWSPAYWYQLAGFAACVTAAAIGWRSGSKSKKALWPMQPQQNQHFSGCSVVVTRKSRFLGCAINYFVRIGTIPCGILGNGGTVSAYVRPGPYKIYFEAKGKTRAEIPIFISADTDAIMVNVRLINVVSMRIETLNISERKQQAESMPAAPVCPPSSETASPKLTKNVDTEKIVPVLQDVTSMRIETLDISERKQQAESMPAALACSPSSETESPKLTKNVVAEKTIPVVQSNKKHNIPPAPAIVHKPTKKDGYPTAVKDRNPMDVIRLMESRFEEQYQFAYMHLLNATDCQRVYNLTVKEFSCLELPLMAQVRFEQLCAEYKEKFSITNPFIAVDAMDSHTFERWCADLLKKIGFKDVEVTQGSGDQGVDILAIKDGIRYAIQCKCYSSDLGNKPVQEVNTGRAIYRCQIGAVMTNRRFTAGGKAAAEATGVLLWDRDWIHTTLESLNAQKGAHP